MRVIVTSPVWTLNGVNTFSASLVRALRDRHVDASLLLTGVDWRDPKPLPPPTDVPIAALPLPALATWPARWRALREYLERAAPCVYLPNHDILHSGIGPLLSSRVVVVGIAHSDDPQHYEHAGRVGRWWNAAVGVSERVTSTLRGFPQLDGVRIARIPYGVQVAPDDVGANERGHDDSARLRILYAGRLEERQKRSHDLLAIARALRDAGTPFTLTIAGDGPLRATLEAESRANALEPHVDFLGTIRPAEVAALCRTHHAFVLPSEYEGLPLALLEAMAQGCVPVASDVASGVPELVDDGVNGFRLPVGDVAAFSARLTMLARDVALRAAMSARARLSVTERRLDVATMAERYLALFDELRGDAESGRYVRPPGSMLVPPGLGWRARLRAPIARWRGVLGSR